MVARYNLNTCALIGERARYSLSVLNANLRNIRECACIFRVDYPVPMGLIQNESTLVMRSNSAVGRASYARYCPTAAIPAC